MRYVRLFKQVASISTSSMLIYRGNVLFFFVFESFFLCANLLGLSMGVDFAGGQLAGWTKQEIIFITMFYQVGHQIFTVFFLGGLFHIGWYVWSGRMDYVLLKPLHPLVSMHSATEFIISNTPNLIINIGLLLWSGYHLVTLGYEFSLMQLLVIFAFFLVSIAVRYGLALLVVTPSLFTEKGSDGEDAYWSLQSLAKYPRGVFPMSLDRFFSFVLPLTTIAAVPAQVFFSKNSLLDLWYYPAYALLFAGIGIKLYGIAIKRYQSVNTGA